MTNPEASAYWLGFDPGGVDRFGAAIIDEWGCVTSENLSSVDEAVGFVQSFLGQTAPMGAGIDAPLWWSGGKGGGRRADQLLRSHYGIASGTVQSANSLKGAAVVQGPLLVERLRAAYPEIYITEAHPEAYLLGPHKTSRRYLRGLEIGSDDPRDDDHKRDAILAALAAREGQLRRWKFDLSSVRHPEEQDPQSYWLAPVHYCWPESVEDEP